MEIDSSPTPKREVNHGYEIIWESHEPEEVFLYPQYTSSQWNGLLRFMEEAQVVKDTTTNQDVHVRHLNVFSDLPSFSRERRPRSEQTLQLEDSTSKLQKICAVEHCEEKDYPAPNYNGSCQNVCKHRNRDNDYVCSTSETQGSGCSAHSTASATQFADSANAATFSQRSGSK